MSETPCSDPSNDPDDWFISRDGKQYPSEEWLTEAEVRGLTRSVLVIVGETPEEHEARVAKAIRAAVNIRRRPALQRRRQAKDACFDCPIRLGCLATAIGDAALRHGTWGGLYEEEIAKVRSKRKK